MHGWLPRRGGERTAGTSSARSLMTPVLLVAGVALAGCGAAAPEGEPVARSAGGSETVASPAGAGTHRIRLRVSSEQAGGEATATLLDTATVRDFFSLLPVTLKMNDLFGREKVGALPRALTSGTGQSTYRVGQLGYWAPSHELAIYYRGDSEPIPAPGIVIIGQIGSGLDAITGADDDFELTIEPVR